MVMLSFFKSFFFAIPWDHGTAIPACFLCPVVFSIFIRLPERIKKKEKSFDDDAYRHGFLFERAYDVMTFFKILLVHESI